ncbi:hypothetical protein OF83DRAFT_1173045 [Amylostereum chailletii]|nr:hypothetical protein OF83DRAFT_1173045 [Amylostereum chailletii]
MDPPSTGNQSLRTFKFGQPADVGNIPRGTGSDPEDELAFAEAFGLVYLASVHTASITLSTLYLDLFLHPSVQHAAQDEIGQAVGRDRISNVSSLCGRDIPSQVGTTTEDSVYAGHFIPKGLFVKPSLINIFQRSSRWAGVPVLANSWFVPLDLDPACDVDMMQLPDLKFFGP